MSNKLNTIEKIIFSESVCINSAKGFSSDILKPLAKYLESDCIAITVMGEYSFDSRCINYNYPAPFFLNIVNNFFYEEKVLQFLKKRVDESRGVCSWATNELVEGDFHSSDMYKERYEPNGIKQGIQSTFITEDDSLCGAIGILRKMDKPFTPKDAEDCNLLTPHIFYSYMKYRWLSSYDFYNYNNLDYSVCAVVQCDKSGKVVAFNSFAFNVFKDREVEMKANMILPKVFLDEIVRLENISKNNFTDKYFYRNIESRFGSYRFISFKTKKTGGYNKLFKKNVDGYLFVVSIEKVSMNLYLKLSDRERQVIKLLSKGLQNKEIAFDLNISMKTCGNHLENIYKKLGVKNRTEATIFAKNFGLNKYKIPKSKY